MDPLQGLEESPENGGRQRGEDLQAVCDRDGDDATMDFLISHFPEPYTCPPLNFHVSVNDSCSQPRLTVEPENSPCLLLLTLHTNTCLWRIFEHQLFSPCHILST